MLTQPHRPSEAVLSHSQDTAGSLLCLLPVAVAVQSALSLSLAEDGGARVALLGCMRPYSFPPLQASSFHNILYVVILQLVLLNTHGIKLL